MSKIRRRDRFGFVYPRSIQSPAFRIGYSLCIILEHPTGPDHPQTSGSCLEKPRPVGYLIEYDFTVLRLTAPRRIAGLKHEFTFAYRPAQIGFQFYLFDGTIPVLQPFIAIYHVRFSIGIHPKCAIERRHMCRQVSRIFHGSVRTFRLVAHQDVTGTSRNDIALYRVYTQRIVGKGGKVIILVVILMQLGSPNLRSTAHP